MLDTPVSDNFNYFLELKKQHLNSETIPFNKKKSYDLLKSNKKSSSGSGSYTEKPNSNCSNCPHRPPKSLTPSSSSSSNSSSTGLISRLPKQKKH